LNQFLGGRSPTGVGQPQRGGIPERRRGWKKKGETAKRRGVPARFGEPAAAVNARRELGEEAIKD